jgi:hypothetical protein
LFCPKCRAEYVARFTRCPDCDVDLVDELPEPVRRATKPRRFPPPLPDVSAFETGVGRSNLLTQHALLWFLCLLPAAYLVTALVPQLRRTADTAVIATALVPLLVCWAVGASQARPRHVGARLLVFVGVAAAYALLLWLLLGRGYDGHLALWVRNSLPVALAAGFLVQNLLSPNAALRRLVRPLTRWRAPWHVYAVALLAWPLIAVLVVELSRHLPAAQSGDLQSGGSIFGFGGVDNTWIALVAAQAVFAATLVVLGRMWVRPRDVSGEPRPDGQASVAGQPPVLSEQHS